MYKACIFDLDGTLTDTLESLVCSVNETLESLFLEPITREQCKAFVGDGARCLVERALRASGDLQAEKIEEAMLNYNQIFARNCMRGVVPYKGIRELISMLKEKGYKLGVLSNKPHNQVVQVVKEVFGEGIFASVQGQQESIPKKPDPRGAFLVSEELEIEPELIAYIGDSEVDYQTGIAAGMKTISVAWGFRSEELLRETGAECIVHAPEEIIEILS